MPERIVHDNVGRIPRSEKSTLTMMPPSLGASKRAADGDGVIEVLNSVAEAAIVSESEDKIQHMVSEMPHVRPDNEMTAGEPEGGHEDFHARRPPRGGEIPPSATVASYHTGKEDYLVNEGEKEAFKEDDFPSSNSPLVSWYNGKKAISRKSSLAFSSEASDEELWEDKDVIDPIMPKPILFKDNDGTESKSPTTVIVADYRAGEEDSGGKRREEKAVKKDPVPCSSSPRNDSPKSEDRDTNNGTRARKSSLEFSSETSDDRLEGENAVLSSASPRNDSPRNDDEDTNNDTIARKASMEHSLAFSSEASEEEVWEANELLDSVKPDPILYKDDNRKYSGGAKSGSDSSNKVMTRTVSWNALQASKLDDPASSSGEETWEEEEFLRVYPTLCETDGRNEDVTATSGIDPSKVGAYYPGPIRRRSSLDRAASRLPTCAPSLEEYVSSYEEHQRGAAPAVGDEENQFEPSLSSLQKMNGAMPDDCSQLGLETVTTHSSSTTYAQASLGTYAFHGSGVSFISDLGHSSMRQDENREIDVTKPVPDKPIDFATEGKAKQLHLEKAFSDSESEDSSFQGSGSKKRNCALFRFLLSRRRACDILAVAIFVGLMVMVGVLKSRRNDGGSSAASAEKNPATMVPTMNPTSEARSSDEDSSAAGVAVEPTTLGPAKTAPTINPTASPGSGESMMNPTASPGSSESTKSTPSVSPTAHPVPAPSTRLPTHMSTKGTTTFYLLSGQFRPEENIESKLASLDLTEEYDAGEFIVHLGGTMPLSATDCPESIFQNFREKYKMSPKPVYMVPSDNDWSRCPDPALALDHWNDHLGSTFDDAKLSWVEARFGQYDILRQYGHAENFAFLHRRVLFVGINAAQGPPGESFTDWNERMGAYISWIEENVANYEGEFDVMVLFGSTSIKNNAGPGGFFSLNVKTIIRQWPWQTLYVEPAKDNLVWEVDTNMEGIDGLTRLSVDEAVWPPLRISVNTTSGKFYINRGNSDVTTAGGHTPIRSSNEIFDRGQIQNP